jgi:dUTP pyrophosphatase
MERIRISCSSRTGRLPVYQSDGAAGADLQADIGEPIVLGPGERLLVPTGLVLAIPEGFEGQVRPRSGLAARHGVTVANAPGTIDCDYRGEVKVILVNLGAESHTIKPGDRVAQLVVAPVVRAEFVPQDELPGSDRGGSGFGSTGR